jgi:hypothetical protein
VEERRELGQDCGPRRSFQEPGTRSPGDGRVALNCKTAPGVNGMLARVASDRFFIPKYVGARSWLGIWLDLPQVDWTQIEDVITEAYRLVAPRALVSKLPKT